MNINIGIDKNTNENVTITQNSRAKGVSIIGPTSSGKISLSVLPMIEADIEYGNGVIYVGENKNLCDAILNKSRDEGRDYVYIDLNGQGTENFNILSLLSEETEISDIVEKCFKESYKIYLKEKLVNSKKVEDISDKSNMVLSMFLGVLKELKGQEMTIRDLYLLSKNDQELVNLVFTGYEKGKTDKQLLLLDMFKKWHESTYCNFDNGLYEDTRYFREMLEELMDNESLKKTLVYAELPKFKLLRSLDKNAVIVVNPLNVENEASLFINRLLSSTVIEAAKLKGTNKINMYVHNCANYVLNNSIKRVNKSDNHSGIGYHSIEESFNPECIDIGYLELIKNNSNIILYPRCTKTDEEIFKSLNTDLSKKEKEAIREIKDAELKTAVAKLLENNNNKIRKIELAFKV